jgi:hypothetical protein
MRRSGSLLALAACIALSLSACTLKATFKQTTDSTSNITGTTSGRTWFTEDGLLRPEHKAVAFAAFNADNLEQDIARGSGEYVGSLGTLLGASSDSLPRFMAHAQDDYRTLYGSRTATPEQMVRHLSQ